jgi:AAA15 family ATPase/GTPase
MAIERVEVKDFLVFKGDFAADFCPGVNVLIGGNGTGKTTLIKALYAFINYKIPEFISEYFQGIRTILDFNRVVILCQDKTGNVVKIDGKTSPYGYSIEVPKGIENYLTVYIPEKDMLTNSKSLPETVEYGKLQYSKCEIDIIKKARVAPNTPEQPLYKEVCKIIGGEPQNDGENFFIKRENIKSPVPFSLEASGFRKFGLLAMLIRNEQIKPGSVLFWDEPENSLNPELMPKLVEILLELSRSGVQIFLATHSEFLANEFFVSSNDDDSLKYFSLYKDESGLIKADTDRRFDLLNPNRLTETSVEQYKRELDKGLDDED